MALGGQLHLPALMLGSFDCEQAAALLLLDDGELEAQVFDVGVVRRDAAADARGELWGYLLELVQGGGLLAGAVGFLVEVLGFQILGLTLEVGVQQLVDAGGVDGLV
ncbi:hypothetical protein [Hymenobacter sp. DG25B]|uniref:hypothetical protein n=1 Tax=Hymenobacter sp. DG25B TaxID=1385664 RepID=UPI0012E06760|nr:hypothetical protein [Hymenobacter sp. DG25B]